MKKGQITIFILIGILLLVFVLVAFYFIGITGVERALNLPIELESVSNVVGECFEFVSKEALITAGEQGGIIDSEDAFVNLFYKIHYGFKDGNITFPTNEGVKGQLRDYVNANFYDCIRKSFDENISNYLKFGNPQTDVEFYPASVLFRIRPELVFSKDGQTKMFEEYYGDFDVRLADVLNISNGILDVVNRGVIPFSSVRLIDPELNINPQSISKDVVIYELTDNLSIIDGEPYLFRFAVDVSINLTGVNQFPVIEDIPRFTVNVGDSFFYKVEASDPEGTALTFDAVTSLFDIGANGEISFTAEEDTKGEHNIPVFVEDVDGGVSTIFLELEIR